MTTTTPRTNKRKFQWLIYKKLRGVQWPGEPWENAKSLAHAKRLMRVFYDNNFRIVRTTLEEYKESKG
jgi:hypothetical protein